MKMTKKLIALFLSLLMLSASCIGVVAQNGGGLIENANYTIGVDLSVFNIGGSKVMNYDSVDFAKMKADGCDFAILRIGFEGSATRANTLDLAFLEYYNRARAAGMKLGIYFYALGTTYTEAVDDAKWVISIIEENDMYFEYPIYYDVEDGAHYALNNDQMTNLCLGWCETLEESGYFGGIYGRDTILNKLTADFRSRYDLWIRSIKTADGEQYDPASMNISNQASLWQYTMLQMFDGCTVQYTSNQLDGNVSYKDYESIMYENGFNNCGEKTSKNLASKKTAVVIGEERKYAFSLTDGIAAKKDIAGASLKDGSSIVVDLKGSYNITKIKVHSSADVKVDALTASKFDLDDMSNFKSIGKLSSDGKWLVLDINETLTARFIKLDFDGECNVDEVEVYGTFYGETENIALGATYEAPKSIRGYTAILNDGVASQTFAAGSANWYGLLCNNGSLDENAPSGCGTIIFDLGRDYALEEILINIGSSADVKKPDAIKVRFASENEGKSAAHANPIYTLNATSDTPVYTASADVSGVCARYVEIEINVYLASNYWAVLNEIEIFGTEFDLDKNLVLPDEYSYLESTDSYSFDKYNGLSPVVSIPAEYNGKPVTAIGSEAFYERAEITNISIPDTAKYVGVNAFYGCTNLKEIELPENLDCIALGAFAYSGITNIVVPEQVKTIERDAFGHCENLESVQLPVSLEKIDIGAFDNCTSLKNITIPDTVTAIGAGAFSECNSLETVIIPASVTSIGEYAFKLCENLTDIYCEAASQPETWDSDWSTGCNATIHWGYGAPEYILGDVDGDGKITADDYIMLKRVYFGTAKLENLESPENALLRCDIDGKDGITADDYILLKRVYFGTAKLG